MLKEFHSPSGDSGQGIPPGRLTGGHNMMRFREQEVLIARYRVLDREVTDPLAASLLHIIILEL
ncbi:hypothetical protein [Bradyrhizobium sp. AUGA SZCCT0283]|uniref:hypothetical protein n=1 Tax=Bradyrhizobium sp. AUGA SZCCT0283 TaxID=2807671 RepID=UPI001BA84EE4|nr:hypothetical protein [Bradyrhizobium sp. AUGA SZCCT0283]MBR1279997.1 hypothetical protein [Bradyrhizobium sp. AUGA SZCCT0283]